MDDSLRQDLDRVEQLFDGVEKLIENACEGEGHPSIGELVWIKKAIIQRTKALAAAVSKTVEDCGDIDTVTRLLLRWMREGATVRIIGAGRAKLAAAIPANRLAHGGARVYIQESIVPMPHSVRGGGIIAASASGETKSVIDIMKGVRDAAPQITVVGIAKHDAPQCFKNLCHHFIGVKMDPQYITPLRALADLSEYVISEVLDALVVGAGVLGGFDDRKWRLGHENIGATGPYDVHVDKIDLLFNEQ
jgi:hypothetical protein